MGAPGEPENFPLDWLVALWVVFEETHHRDLFLRACHSISEDCGGSHQEYFI